MSTECDVRAIAELLAPRPGGDEHDAWDPERDEALFTALTGPAAPQTRRRYIAPRHLRRAPSRPQARREPTSRIRTRSLSALAVSVVVAALTLIASLSSAPRVASAYQPVMLDYATAGPDAMLTGAAPAARTALLQLARATAQRTTPVRGGDVQYLENYGWQADTNDNRTHVYPTHVRRWISPDGSVLLRTNRDLALSDLHNLEGYTPATTTPLDSATDDLPAGSLTPTDVTNLPRDPGKLRAYLLSTLSAANCAGPENETACLANSVAVLHDTYVIPADLDAALWTMLAQEPGVGLLGAVTDRAGRSGTAVAYLTHNGPDASVQVLIGSTTDGALLDTESVAYHGSEAGSGQVRSLEVIEDGGWVSARDQVPGAGAPVARPTSGAGHR